MRGLFFLLTWRISWAVACASKASFDSFDLNGGFFTEVFGIGHRSEKSSPPLRCNTGVLSGTQECKTQKNLITYIFFSDLTPTLKRLELRGVLYKLDDISEYRNLGCGAFWPTGGGRTSSGRRMLTVGVFFFPNVSILMVNVTPAFKKKKKTGSDSWPSTKKITRDQTVDYIDI